MALLKDLTLTDSIEIDATPEKIFRFLTNLVDDETYRAWHPEDHVSLRWIKGQPWEEGSVVHAEEYIHGKLHKLKFVVTKVVPHAEIEYAPVSRFLRRYFPKNTFTVEPKEDTCIFTAAGTYRVGWLVRTFAKKKLEHGLSSVKKHMKEEGENLKKILEAEGSSHNRMDSATAEAYDDEAEATGWFGPEVTFGLAYQYIKPGQSILDIGIGTGLGSVLFRKAGLKVYGMDVSQDMLDACRSKGFPNLTRHDLTEIHYPYDSESLDHIISVGVLNFFSDLSPVFRETARIIHRGGLFAFVVGDRTEEEAREVVVGTEHTKSNEPVTMYRHSAGQISGWLKEFGFTPLRSLAFTVYMDREKTQSLQAKAYLARKTTDTKYTL